MAGPIETSSQKGDANSEQFDGLTSRVKKLEDQSASARITSRASIIAACVAVAGVCATGAVQYYGHKETARANDERNKTDQARVVVDQARATSEIKRMYADRLEKLGSGYETKRETIKVIASIYGVPEAVYVESTFRSGATIRGLQDLLSDLEARVLKVPALQDPTLQEHVDLVNQSLESVPRVLFVDSRKPANVYCKDSIQISATNVDDIIDLIKDLPVRITAMIGDGPGVGPSKVADKVAKYSEKLRLIVIHAGAFELVTNDLDGEAASKRDQDKVGSFLAHIEKQGYAGKVIVYSRDRNMPGYINEELVKRRKDTIPLKLKLIPVDLDGHAENDEGDLDCFREKSHNARLIQRAIQIALAYDNAIKRE